MNAVIAFLVVLALAVATWLLGRSLFKHLRKVPDSFDPPPGADGHETPDGTREPAAPGQASGR